MKKLIFIISVVFMGTGTSYAESTIESLGNYTQVIVPAYAFGLAMNEPDYTGAKEFVIQFATMEIAVNGLKYLVPEERPDHSDKHSFPSGHTASAFSGAAFIHKRYGIKRAIIPYIAAGFTGFSRVQAKRHHIHDVIAGGAIGGATGYFLTSRINDNTTTNVELSPQNVTLRFNSTF
ncbi:MAG: phosphatase PAP2 family protein [Alphaproteobacteria bacterium]|nr:phosphatase PAP2 family protein [Alphaproteobacteria bacterium]